MRRFGLPGNVCRVAVRLGAGMDADRLRHQVESSPVFDWLSRLKIQRPWRLFPPIWQAIGTRQCFFEQHAAPDRGTPSPEWPNRVYERELHAAVGPALAFDLTARPDGTHELILSWNHSLLDARGAELILRHLHSAQNGDAAAFLEVLIRPGQEQAGFLKWWNSMGKARRSLPWLKESGRAPLFSLADSLPQGAKCRNRMRILTFSKDETTQMGTRCQQLNAAFRRSHFYMAASLRAVHAVALRRGGADRAYLIPVPHDTRKRGAKGPVFSNHLSILFYRIEAGIADNPGAVVEELTRQMMEQIRTEFPSNAMSALEMFKPLPLGPYLYQLGKPSRGAFASFCFSDSGETCAGFQDIMGAPIESVLHYVPTWRPPGLTILFWSFNGKPHALLSYTEDCVSESEADLLERTLRSCLIG